MPSATASLLQDTANGLRPDLNICESTTPRLLDSSTPRLHRPTPLAVQPPAMDNMFRDFSFDPASREVDRTCTVSPFSHSQHPARPPTPPPCSMLDLAHKFLNIEVDSSPRYRSCHDPPTPPSDDFAFPVELLDTPQQSYLYPRLSAGTLRKQRQANTRMQCSPSHLEDISMLVQQMIEVGDQCRICDSKSHTSSNASSSDDDEGVDVDFGPSAPQEPHVYTLKFRRSGDRLNASAAVSKSVRMRRKSGITKKSSK